MFLRRTWRQSGSYGSGRSTPGREDSKSKDPEMGACPARPTNIMSLAGYRGQMVQGLIIMVRFLSRGVMSFHRITLTAVLGITQRE